MEEVQKAAVAQCAGREVVGRKIAVWKPKAGIWRNGTVSDFSVANLRHMVRPRSAPCDADMKPISDK